MTPNASSFHWLVCELARLPQPGSACASVSARPHGLGLVVLSIVWLALSTTQCAFGQCAHSCFRVYFDGPYTAATCAAEWTITPCNNTLRAYAPESNLEFGTNCICFTNPPTWRIEAADGGGTLGLKISGGCTDSCQCEATIEPEGSLDAVQEGALNVYLENEQGSKSGTVMVKVQKDGCTPQCNQVSPSGGCIANPFGQASTCNSSVSASFKLGRSVFGKRAGVLSLKETMPTNLLCTPLCLSYKFGTNNGCEVIKNCTGFRQVKMPEGLVNIVTNSTYKYSVEFYALASVGSKYTNGDCTGCYNLSGAPLLTHTVENLDSGSSTNRLRVTDGYGLVSDFEWKTNGWELVKAAGMLREQKSSVWSETNTLCLTTVETRDSNSNVVAVAMRKYRVYPFGQKLIEDARGSGGSALTNSYQYATSGSSSGLLQQVTRATGGWEMYQYVSRSRLTNVLSAFLNQAPTNNSSLCRMVEHSYTTNDPVDFGRLRFNFPRRTVESLLGHEIARSYTVVSASELREIQCATAGATYTNADNLVTITKWYTNGANLDRRCSIEKPDGTMQLFQYGFYTNGSGDIFRTNIVLTGAPDSYKTNIIDGSKSIIVLGAVGQLLSRTTIDIASAITTGLETFSDYDSFNRPRKVTFLDNTYTWTDYGCCGPVNQTNREGTAIAYYKDGLQRHASTVTGGLTRTNVFDAAGNVLKRIRGGSDGTQITQLTNGYDTAGRLLTSRDALGNITTYTESLSSFQLSRTTTEHGRGS